MINVFIGYDPREAVAFSVLQHSIHEFASEPVSVTPLCLPQLRPVHQRERHALQSTDFSFTRFLVPFLCDYKGWALFLDCDMLFRDDIAKLWSLRDERYALQVVKHQHVPPENTKFLGQPQTRYEKKNWSSVMLFNNARCRALDPAYVNRASGLDLHQFRWIKDDADIGALPPRWNHLVGYDRYDADAGNVHFTAGGPYFNEYRGCDYAAEWFEALHAMQAVVQRRELSSVALPR